MAKLARTTSLAKIDRRHGAALRRRIFRDRWLYLLFLPFLLWILLFCYRPMWGLQVAFKDYSAWKGVDASPWIGFEHFVEFFQGPFFVRNLVNTFMISLYSLAFGFPAPIILALMLNELRSLTYKKLIQTLTYLPYFISAVIVAGIVVNFLWPTRGILNVIIVALGGKSVDWLFKPEYFRGIYTIMTIWKDTGFGAIVYLAAIAGVDMQLYDACRIDGGGRFRQIWHVTVPCILPTVVMMFILRMGGLLSVGHEAIILLYQPTTYETADVISTYVFRMGIQRDMPGLAAAVGLLNSLVAFVLVMATNFVSRRVSEISLW